MTQYLYMLAQRNRFHGHGSMRFVFQKGTSARSRRLMVRSTHNPKRTHPRIAVVVSKKVSKSAVVRNRIRRRLFEIVRHELSSLPSSIDVVISVFSAELAVDSYESVRDELSPLLHRVAEAADNSSK